MDRNQMGVGVPWRPICIGYERGVRRVYLCDRPWVLIVEKERKKAPDGVMQQRLLVSGRSELQPAATCKS